MAWLGLKTWSLTHDCKHEDVIHLDVAIRPGVELVGEVGMDGDPGHVIILDRHRLDLAAVVVLAQADLDCDLGEGVRPPTSGTDPHAAVVHTVTRRQHEPVGNNES